MTNAFICVFYVVDLIVSMHWILRYSYILYIPPLYILQHKIARRIFQILLLLLNRCNLSPFTGYRYHNQRGNWIPGHHGSHRGGYQSGKARRGRGWGVPAWPTGTVACDVRMAGRPRGRSNWPVRVWGKRGGISGYWWRREGMGGYAEM